MAELIRTGLAALERPLHPVLERETAGIPYLYWPARGRKGAEFSEEFFAFDIEPGVVLEAVQSAHPGPDHLIAEIAVATSPQADYYRASGYEFGSAEPLMCCELPGTVDSGAGTTRRVATMADVDAILAAHASIGYPMRLFNEDLLADPLVTVRAIWEGSSPIAIGKAALLPTGAYLTDIMTMPMYRKLGHGAAIVRALHADAIRAGCRLSVLTSTAMAQSLYHSLGYTTIGTVTLYATPEHE